MKRFLTFVTLLMALLGATDALAQATPSYVGAAPVPAGEPVRMIPTSAWHLRQGASAAGTASCIAEGGSVKLDWQEAIAAECEVGAFPTERLYTLEGRALAQHGDARLTLTIRQFAPNYPVADPPDTVTELTVPGARDGAPFSVPFYLRTLNSKVTITIEAVGAANAVTLREVVVRGGGPYVSPFTSQKAKVVEVDESGVSKTLAGRTWEQAEIAAENGTAGLRIGGKVVPKFFYSGNTMATAAGGYGLFADKGVHLLAVNDCYPWVGGAVWSARGAYDFTKIERSIRRVLAVDPQARIILGVWADTYPEWGVENPDDVCANSAGMKAIGDSHFKKWDTGPVKPGRMRFLPSVFSAKAQRDVSEMLLKIDEWTDTHELGKAVIGFYLWGFNDADFGHWVHPATSGGEKDLDDYSPAAQGAYRAWLQKKYRDDSTALSRAWGQPGLSFATVTLPTPERRRVKAGELFPWLGPAEEDVRDFNQFYGEAPGALVAGITSELVSRMRRKKLVLTHFGNVMHGWRGYVGLDQVIHAPGINGLTATSDYNIRWPGYAGGFDSVPDSIRLNGKAFFHEFDHRSFTSLGSKSESYDFAVGRAKDAGAHEAMFLREAGNIAAHGQGIYGLDLQPPSYADDRVMNGVAKGYQLFASLADSHEAPEADMALFVNEQSISSLCEDPESSRFLMRLTRRHRPQWDTSGVPYHLYLQSDLTHPRLPAYKVYVFLTPQAISAEERQAINALKRDGHTLVFLHAPGLLNKAPVVDSVAAISGMKVAMLPGPQPLAGVWLPSPNPLVNNLAGRFGDRPIKWPFTDRESRGLAFAVTDPAAVPLAKYRDTADIACAVKEFPEWRCVFMGVPWLEASFIANLAGIAGAWRAGEPHDAVFASQHLITIHALSAGKKTLRPRRPSRITDAITGAVVADQAAEFIVNMAFGQTRIFRTEPQSGGRPK